MRKIILKIAISLILGLLAVFAGLLALYQAGFRIVDYGQAGSPDITIKNLSQITPAINAMSQKLFVQFSDENGEYISSLEDLGIGSIPQNYFPENCYIRISDIAYEFPQEDIINAVAKLNRKQKKGYMGHLIETSDGIRITESEECTKLDVEYLSRDIENWLATKNGLNSDTLSINLPQYYIGYVPTTTEKQAQAKYQQYTDFNIRYAKGASFVADDFYKNGLILMDGSGFIPLRDKEQALDILKKMCKKSLYGYNTVGLQYKFTTHDKRQINVDSVTYGDYIDYSGEAEYLYKLLSSMTGEDDRIPVMKQTAYSSINDTYIEVDIDEQHAYYYQGGELKWDSDVVTGKLTKARQTHTGIYFIYNKFKNIHLQKWNVDVERWMSVTYDGQGFHDAKWRNAFGGDIYVRNGSHGCINTPRDMMFALYDLVEVGTPVVIYQNIQK